MKPSTPAIPHAILMIGIPGAGKSTFAERFSDTFQAPIISYTTLTKKYHVPYAAADGLIEHMIDQVAKTHRTLIIDGSANTKAQRATIAKKLQKQGYKLLTVWVQTDTNEAKRRALKKYPKGSELTSDEFDAAVSAFQPPASQEKAVVISGKHTYATQLKGVLRQIATTTPRATSPPVVSPVQNPRPRGIDIR
tara:strand:- start:436 stop:1014 length:579 start_codon:yes stop_codon:yes gene_type:complete